MDAIQGGGFACNAGGGSSAELFVLLVSRDQFDDGGGQLSGAGDDA